MTGPSATTATVAASGIGFGPTTVSITPGSITSVSIPTSIRAVGSGTKESKGIRITSPKEITVYGLNQVSATTDAFLGLPTDILGTEYLVGSFRNRSSGLVPKRQLELFDPNPYEYRAIATNREEEAEEVMDLHNQRGELENYIKELKGGFGMEWMPCGGFQGRLEKALGLADFQPDEAHQAGASRIISALLHQKENGLSDLIVETAVHRRFLG